MKHLPSVLLFPALLLAGCGVRERAPAFIDAAGRRQPLAVEGGGSYSLRRPARADGQEQAFFLRVPAGAAGRELRVLDPEGRVLASCTLFSASIPLTLLVALPRGALVSGFTLKPAPEAADAVEEAGITEALAGFERTDRELRVGALRRLVLGSGYAEAELDAEAFSASAEPGRWRIELEYESYGPASWADFRRFEGGAEEAFNRRALAVLRLAGSGRQTVLEHRALPGGQRLFLYPGTVGFTPVKLSLRPEAGGYLDVRALRVEPRLTGTGIDASSGAPAVRPLPADPGTILLYDRGAWRQPDYELFAWARFPQILILDTADYTVQDRFFKRLAFFVEKLGYRGRLVSFEEVADLHGFNAHDYRAEDLARFYRAAAASAEPLTAEEQQLKRILIANGILLGDGGLEPGRGAILSISQSSSDTLRRLLLTHEALHGLYFTLPRYREACSAAWRALDREEREFWLLFLRWWHYDIDDPFLTVNEFQAYLLQQSRSGLGFYFGRLSAGRLERSYPQQAAWLARFLAARPESFERAYDLLEPALRLEAGLEGGRLVELERAE
jgi:hypothetical protein